MNKWQITGLLHNEPQYSYDKDREAQVMQFTLINTTIRHGPRGERKINVWVACTWHNPPKEDVMLLHKGEMAYVEGMGYQRVKKPPEGCPSYMAAIEVESGGWRPHPPKTPHPREKLA